MDQQMKDKLTLVKNKTAASIQKLEKERIAELHPEWKDKIDYLKKVLAKAEELLAKANGGDLGGDWQKEYAVIENLIKTDAYFAPVFGTGEDLLQGKRIIEDKEISKAADVKEKTNTWYGQHADNTAIPKEKTSMILAAFERAKAIIKKAQENNGAKIGMRFFGSSEPDCRKMSKVVDQVAENVQKNLGIKMQIEKIEQDDFESMRKKYNLEHVPTVAFTREGSEIARHEGVLSISGLQKKVDMLSAGGTFSDSSSVEHLDDQRTVSDREVYSLGEFVILYFNDHLTNNCGQCKRMDPIYDNAVANFGGKIKMQTFDASSTKQFKIVEKYSVTHIPTAIFIHKGKEKGRFVGYIDNTTVEKWIEDFVINEKATDISNTGAATSILNRHISKMDKAAAAEARRKEREEQDKD